MRNTVIVGVFGVVALVLGGLWGPELPPDVGLVVLVPLFLAGVALFLQGAVAHGLGLLAGMREDHPVHLLLQVVGAGLIVLGLLGFAKLPPAGARDTVRLSGALASVCAGEPGVRVERQLLPMLDRLHEELARQDGAVRARAVEALETHLPRCVAQTREAFADPRGTHTSWSLLRAWMVAHPDLVEVPDELRDAPFERRRHRPVRRPVAVEL